jgi:hypothetical protein
MWIHKKGRKFSSILATKSFMDKEAFELNLKKMSGRPKYDLSMYVNMYLNGWACVWVYTGIIGKVGDPSP